MIPNSLSFSTTIAILAVGPASAVDRLWIGNTDANWATNGNWNPSGTIVGDSAFFGSSGTSGTVLSNNTGNNSIIYNITFNSGATNFTLNGNAINLGGNNDNAAITNNSTATQSINFQVNLAGRNGDTRTINANEGDLVFGTVFNNGNNKNLIVTGAAETTIGLLTNGAGGVLTLSKQGLGTLTLNGANTYTGTTTVSAGTLLINGDQGASTGNVMVASGATLGGGGTLGGSTTIQAGGTLAAGNSTGTLTFDNPLTLTSGSIFEWELDALTSDSGELNKGTYDRIIADGAVTGTSTFNIILGTNAFSDEFWNTDKSWTDIFTGTGTFDLSNIFTSFGGTGVDSSGLVTGQGQFSFSSNTLLWTASVPEPTSALSGILIAAGLLRRRRSPGSK